MSDKILIDEVPSLQPDSRIIEFVIFNLGWSNQTFNYSLINSSTNNELYSDWITINNNSELTVQIDVSDFSLNNEDIYILRVVPEEKASSVQEVYFSIENNTGDFNNDNITNVLDIIIMVNSIMSNNFSNVYDLNNDDLNNVLDIIILVNIILD